VDSGSSNGAIRKFSYPLDYPNVWDRNDNEFFNPKNFTKFLQLISETLLEHLEFTAINWIPTIMEECQASSVKVLKLAGSCKLEDKVNSSSRARSSSQEAKPLLF